MTDLGPHGELAVNLRFTRILMKLLLAAITLLTRSGTMGGGNPDSSGAAGR